jgi:hypothetical protein
MGHITRIAAVENTTAIWEYDPALPDNRVLGGSLDVIASLRTTAIKVSDLCLHILQLLIRYRPQVNESNILKNFKSNARSLTHSKSLSIATFNGGQHIICLIGIYTISSFKWEILYMVLSL